MLRCVARLFERAVGPLPDEDENDAQQGARQQPEQGVENMVRLVGRAGRLRRINDADIAGPHSGGDAGFLDPLQKIAVKLTAGFDLPLIDVVLNSPAALLGDKPRLIRVVVSQQLFAAASGLVFIANAPHNMGTFFGNDRIELVDLHLHGLELGVRRGESALSSASCRRKSVSLS